MKKTLYAIVVGAALLVSIVGCTSEKMQSPCDVDCHSTNQSQQSSFNSEDYVWEEWFFGTNKTYYIDSIDK